MIFHTYIILIDTPSPPLENPYISSQTLFNAIQEPILNNSSKNSSNPQWGPMRESGDEGGDFIFIRK